jgi:hypothetical protein
MKLNIMEPNPVIYKSSIRRISDSPLSALISGGHFSGSIPLKQPDEESLSALKKAEPDKK